MGIQPILYGTNGGGSTPTPAESDDLLTLKIMSVDNEFIKEGEIDESELDYIISGNGTEGTIVDPNKIVIEAINETSIGYDGDKYTSFLTDKEYKAFGSTLKELNFPNLQRYKSVDKKDYNVEKVYFPELTEITRGTGNQAFNIEGGELTSENLPKIKTFGNSDIFTGTGFTNINLPTLESVNNGSFGGSKLRTVTLENATSLGYLSFLNCSQLEEVYAPKVKSIGMGCFQGTPKLSEIDFPVATSIAGAAFYGCGARILSLPSAESFGGIGFGYMGNLEEVYFPSLTSLSGGGGVLNQQIKKIQLTSLNSLESSQGLVLRPCSCACETAIDLCRLQNWDIDIQFNTENNKYIYIQSIASMDEQITEIPANVTIWTYYASSEVLEAHKGQATIEYGKTHQEFIDEFFNGRYEGPIIFNSPSTETRL